MSEAREVMMLEQYADTNIELFPNNTRFRISFDPSMGKLKIVSSSYDELQQLKEAFTAPDPSAFFSQQYGYNRNVNRCMINKFGYFPAGLVFSILDWIKNQYGDASCLAMSQNTVNFIKDYLTPLSRMFKNVSRDDYVLSNVSDDTGRNSRMKLDGKPEYQFRDYQQNAILKWMFTGKGRGLIELPTGAGKSFVIANYIWNILKNFNNKLKTLIFVPNKQLVEQFYKDLLDYGFDKIWLTKFTAGLKKTEKFDPEARIIIANRQYVFSNIDKLPKIDILVCDEIHQVGIQTASYDFIERLNCQIKVGCSGTIPREKFHRWSLLGLFGNIVYTEQIVDLQKKGFISKLKISLLKVTDTVVENDRSYLFHRDSIRKYYQDPEKSDLMFNDAYNSEIEYMNKHYIDLYSPILYYISDNLSGNTLILFDRIEFGTNMFELAKEKIKDKDIFYIDGQTKIDVREENRKKMEESSNNILFGQSAVMSTGINIKRLNNIVFFFSGKSFSRILQSIGRTLRLHKEKEMSNVIDISFNFKYSERHLKERLQIYKNSYGKKPDEIIKLEI